MSTKNGILIGCGQRGRQWVQVMAEDDEVNIAAFVDINPAALEEFSGKYPGVPTFLSLEEALEGVSADFAVLVTPPMGHKDELLTLFEAGLHVMAEKPLALNIPDALEIITRAAELDRKLGLSLNFRYLPVSQEYRKWITERRLGEPSYSLYHYAINRDGTRPGGNRYPLTLHDAMLIDQSIHHFDLMRFCLDAEILNVTAKSWNPSWSMYSSDSVVSTIFELDNGVHCVYLGSWTGGWNGRHVNWRTDCSEGILIMRQIHSDLAYAKMDDAEFTAIPIADEIPYIDDSRRLLKNFLGAVEGREALECSGLDHLRTLVPTIACAESRDRGVTINIEEFYREHGVDKVLARYE